MSLIKETSYTPFGINGIKFRIPLYQRPYAWETNQVNQLLNDLYNQFKKDEFEIEKKENYYIGILSVGKTDTDENLYDLIDGQQRITTLMLIGRVFAEDTEEWKIFLCDRLDLYGRDIDKEYLKTLDTSLNPNPKMVEAVKVIREFIKNNEEKISIVKFSNYIFKKASFFISEVPEDYTIIEKNLQFVRMNNRGKQLEAHDILKIKLARYFKDEEQKQKDFVKEWNKYSQLGCFDERVEFERQESKNPKKSIEEILKNPDSSVQPKETEIFYQSIVTYPEFLLIALERFFNEQEELRSKTVSHRKEKLLEEFGFGEKELDFKWEIKKVEDFWELLRKQYEAFNKYFIKRDKNEAYKFKRKADSTDDFDKGTEQNVIQKLEVFESYLYVSREAHNWLSNAFDYVMAQSEKIKAKEFLEELKRNDNEFKNSESKSLIYGDIDRYWFWRLDYYLWEVEIGNPQKTPESEAIIKYNFRANRSIEHLHPQSKPEGWEDGLHSFGNLAMISTGFNSTQSADIENVKFARIENQINAKYQLESIKIVKMYQIAGKKHEYWTVEIAKKHGNDMIDVLINSFPDTGYEDIREKLRVQKNAIVK